MESAVVEGAAAGSIDALTTALVGLVTALTGYILRLEWKKRHPSPKPADTVPDEALVKANIAIESQTAHEVKCDERQQRMEDKLDAMRAEFRDGMNRIHERIDRMMEKRNE